MLAQILDNAVYMFISILFYFFKYGEATIIPYVIHAFIMAVFLIFMPESPVYLHYKKQFTKAKSVFKLIAKFNKKPLRDFHFIEEDLI